MIDVLLIKLILKIPILIIKGMWKMIAWCLKRIFGLLFGWIPDFDERMSGEAFEEYVKEILKRNGFRHLQLTKKTGDYGIDILGEYEHQKYAIQCKKYSRPVGVSAVQQVYTGCVFYECDIAVVVTNHRFTAAAIALAQINGVELWDGKKLEKLKRKANSHALFHRHMDEDVLHPYYDVIDVLLENGYASLELLMDELHYSEEKAFYILDDLEFCELISCEDDEGKRLLEFNDYKEAIALLNK